MCNTPKKLIDITVFENIALPMLSCLSPPWTPKALLYPHANLLLQCSEDLCYIPLQPIAMRRQMHPSILSLTARTDPDICFRQVQLCNQMAEFKAEKDSFLHFYWAVQVKQNKIKQQQTIREYPSSQSWPPLKKLKPNKTQIKTLEVRCGLRRLEETEWNRNRQTGLEKVLRSEKWRRFWRIQQVEWTRKDLGSSKVRWKINGFLVLHDGS